MLSVREAGVLPPGTFEASGWLDNYDRDPLGLDIVDGTVGLRLGVVTRLEVYFGYQITRSVSSPGSHPVPSPPLDVVALTGGAPAHPYRAMYWPMPYLSHHGARVGDMVSGEYTVGARTRLFEQRGARPAFSVSAQLTGPGTTARYDLSKGSGSGGVDFGLHAAASWRHQRLRVAANLGTTVTSGLDPSDRFILVGDGHAVQEAPIVRPNFVHAGLGARFRAWRRVWAVAEWSGWGPFGDRTPMQSESGASDLLAGVLVPAGNATFALGVRWHLRAQAHGLVLSTGPLAGALDLSNVDADARAAFLDSFGVTEQRHGANLVVTGFPAGVSLPDGARYIDETYETATQGNIGLAFRLSFRFGQ
jgi:hypothetical protein